MKSTETPWTHTGVTASEIETTVGPSKYPITVPAGTKCRKLDGGNSQWVVDDLAFIDDKKGILYSDADIYGIRIPENNITGVTEVSKSSPPRMRG